MIKHNMTFKEQIEEKNMIEMLTERPGRLKKNNKKQITTEAEKGGFSSQRMGREIFYNTNRWYSQEISRCCTLR